MARVTLTVFGGGGGEVEKVMIRRAVSQGHLFVDAKSCVDFLNSKLAEKVDPTCVVKEIDPAVLHGLRC